jgi:hypothetical protein
MASHQQVLAEAPQTNDFLVDLLAKAEAALALLRERTRQLVSLGNSAPHGFSPGQLETLCTILDEGRSRVHRRLVDFVGECDQAGPSADSHSPVNIENPLMFLGDYRACCRRLCKAMKEALRISDATTGAVLSDLMLRLEKQLWLMDTPRLSSGTEPYRSISLFLTC